MNIDKNRNLGIDLLRVLSMLYIVILHTLKHGGILSSVLVNSNQYKLVWFLEISVYCAVNILALISGYVSDNEKSIKIRIEKYLVLLFQVIFYGLLITIVFNIINPNMVTVRDYVNALLPLVKNEYWYFSAYTGMIILSPFINYAVTHFYEKRNKKLFLAIFITFSLFIFSSREFKLNGGYSTIWLLILYTLGLIIKKEDIGKNLKVSTILLTMLGLNIFTYIWKMYIGMKIIRLDEDILIDYCSPTILLSAMLYIILFSRFVFNNDFIKKTIRLMASSSFAIYLLNDNPLIRNNLLEDRFVYLSSNTPLNILLTVIGFSFLFVFVSIIIDIPRQYLFKAIHIKDISHRIVERIDSILDTIL